MTTKLQPTALEMPRRDDVTWRAAVTIDAIAVDLDGAALDFYVKAKHETPDEAAYIHREIGSGITVTDENGVCWT